ncbi:hypothetical protein [Mycolicibacterium sediminis]|uniref:Membrane protein n=1 Tax=Mycolicibacterium sediminis TaxID=1286180 RepID=A0A7I7QNC1_9MYCO|nr:hypothetical protein [Mycolicibacterium sediminis]BBY27510.1 membrane protein [Mycolicibacterium sediminis]
MPAYALALALLVTGPLLGPGYLLLRDAVSTPRSYLTDAALGLSEAAPRALPQDFLVAVLSSMIDGGVLVKALLIAGLWAAGWGAAHLVATVVPDAGLAGRFVAATLAIWNPYVAERLLQGHWSLLVGYGALPWVAAAVLRARSGDGGWWPVVGSIAVAGLTPTGLMLAAVVALAGCAAPGGGRPRWACAAVSMVAAVAGALPWLVASVVGDSLASSQAVGISAFAARAEPGLGTLGSLAGLGGIWNADAIPASRTSLFAVVATVVLLAVVAVGLPVALRRPGAVALLVLAGVAVVAPALMATGPGLAAVESIVRSVPGLGVLRDGQKWVALALPGYAVAAGAAVVTLRGRVPAVAAAAVCCAALVAVLPDLAWGVGGQMTAVRYPAGWTAVARAVNADPRPVAVLPPDSMRTFGWAGTAPVLDPLPRWVSADVLSTGDLVIGGEVIPGEGVRAREVQRLLLEGADASALARAGVGWVMVESGAAALDLPVTYRDDDLVLYRVGGDHPPAAHRGTLIAAHLVWLATILAAVVGGAVGALRRRRAAAAASQ